MSFKIDNTYKNWLKELKTKVHSAQIKAALAVNTELIQLYWELGKMISEKLEESQWGDKILKNVSNDLRAEFPNMRGLSVTNLKYSKYFYDFYSNSISQQVVDQLESADREGESLIGQQDVDQSQNSENQTIQQAVGQTNDLDNKQIAIRQQDVAQIPWGHNILIFTKCKSVDIALFYVQQTIENQWSRIVLKEEMV